MNVGAPQVTVDELIRSGECHPMCLLAQEPLGCACACGGQWHGRLVGVEIQPATRADWSSALGYSSSILALIPYAKTQDQANQIWRAASAQGREAACWVDKFRGGFSFTWDLWTKDQSCRDDDDQWQQAGTGDVLTRLGVALVGSRVARSSFGGPGTHLSALGFRTLPEARTVAFMVGECWHGNGEGAARAASILEGSGDPVCSGLVPSSYLRSRASPFQPRRSTG